MTAVWFSGLDPVHEVYGRVRFKYRLNRDVIFEPVTLTRQIAQLQGVNGQRLNMLARSLIVHFNPAESGAGELQKQILALSAGSLATTAIGSNGSSEHQVTATAVAGSLAGLGISSVLPPSARLLLATAMALPLFCEAVEEYPGEGINSHVLEALAVGISLARGDYLAASATTFMLTLGEYLEQSIARQSDELLKRLLNPTSSTAWVERGGREVEVSLNELIVGDTVIVGTGTIIPIDGTVLGGEATINEAAMTGESIPVIKSRGDAVLSGTLMEEGCLRVYAERVGAQTAVARIAEYVEHSLTTKSTTQLKAAELADRLVPFILGLAGASFVVSGSLQRAAAVLQADYACALKLATPVAFKSSMYHAGRGGILVKGAQALEKLAEADTFVFDKTGTLTAGALQVTDVIAFDSAYTADDLLCLAASVEEHYVHPIAKAVVDAAHSRTNGYHFDHKKVEFVVAHGVASIIDGKRVVIGSRHFVEDDEGIDISPYNAQIDSLLREGKTALYVGFGGRLLGILGLRDSMRSNSAATIARLRSLGVTKIIMLTGDHMDRASQIAQELGLDNFHADLMPEDKAAILQALQDQGAKIAFVGDGINDAPALAGAHVGIAMQNGADVARLTADIALLEDDIGRVADAKALALATMQRITTNYHLTVGLNTAILAGAAFGLLSPIATTVLHNGSTIAILLNALRRAMRLPNTDNRHESFYVMPRRL